MVALNFFKLYVLVSMYSGNSIEFMFSVAI